MSRTVGISVRGSVKCDHSMSLSESVQLTGFDSSSCLVEEVDDHDGHRMVGCKDPESRDEEWHVRGLVGVQYI